VGTTGADTGASTGADIGTTAATTGSTGTGAGTTGAGTPAPPAEPQSEKYPATEEGLRQFITEHDAWEQANPDAAAAAKAARGEQPAAAETKTAEQIAAETPAAEAEAGKETPPAAATEALPKAFDDAIAADPALKAALEANPAARELVMEAARASEAAKPILALAPTLEAAQFMARQANVVLDVRHNMLMGVEDPEARTAGFNGLKEQFIETDDKGQPMRGADGKPVYGKDYDLCLRTPASLEKLAEMRDQVVGQIRDLEAKTKGVYPDQAAKDTDLSALEDAGYTRDALNCVLSILSPAPEGPPALPPDATPEQRAFQERLERQQAEFRRQQEDAGKGAQANAVRQFEQTQRVNWQKGVGKGIDDYLTAAKARGEVIPEYLITRPWIDPATGQASTIPAVSVEILTEYDRTVMGIPTERAELQRLQRLGPAGAQQRETNAARLRNSYLTPIIQRKVREMQDGLRESQKAEADRQQKIAGVARNEPQSSGGGSQPVLTEAQLETKARETAEKDPRWAGGDEEIRAAILMSATTRLKYGY
jgi:hypothetical protein